ncbi:hypothetical protein HY041_03100 [Candidatus Roizmanbacteria bacterium]|nr:hypothetical protein [Candidatus Roizmanbacteria bacterium]
MIKQSNKNNQSGQVLLIIVMILATVLAITFSLSFTSTTDTQTAKLEEESKRALAAAQAILEASIKQNVGTYTLGNLGLNNLSGFSGSATVLETTGNIFITPLIQKDEQYTFYLSAYPGLASYSSLSIDLYLNSEASCPNSAAVELTYINSDSSLTRSLIDPCDRVTKNGGSDLATTTGDTINGVIFNHKTNAPISINNKKLVFIRALFTSTKIGIKEVLGNNLASQGKITTAQAQTSGSVASTVSLFQSYPQIPSDFFISSF